jgi:thiol-disulfide isomerase/thioredoxin
MQEQTNRTVRRVTYVLLVIGILGISFLGYVIGSRLLSPTIAIAPNTTPETSVSGPTIVSEPDDMPEAHDTEDPASILTGIRVGQRAPDFVLRSLEDAAVALSDYIGRVVILDFWASWCGPCKSTMPGLENLASNLAPDVVLIGVSLDRSAANASDYLVANDFDAMIALYESYAAASKVFKTYGGGGIPKTYVIDRAGIIRYVGHPASLPHQVIERLI